jgi:hypothetical protein
LFNNAVSTAETIQRQMRRKNIDNEEIRVWKETVASYSKVLQYLLGDTEDNNEGTYSVVPTFIPGLLAGIKSYRSMYR